MAGTSLVKKLYVKPGMSLGVFGAPAWFLARLAPLPEGATISERGKGPHAIVFAFAENTAALARVAPKAIAAVIEGGSIWIAYPKKSSAVKTNISRDVGWEAVESTGWDRVSIISLDDTWSALRFLKKA